MSITVVILRRIFHSLETQRPSSSWSMDIKYLVHANLGLKTRPQDKQANDPSSRPRVVMAHENTLTNDQHNVTTQLESEDTVNEQKTATGKAITDGTGKKDNTDFSPAGTSRDQEIIENNEEEGGIKPESMNKDNRQQKSAWKRDNEEAKRTIK